MIFDSAKRSSGLHHPFNTNSLMSRYWFLRHKSDAGIDDPITDDDQITNDGASSTSDSVVIPAIDDGNNIYALMMLRR